MDESFARLTVAQLYKLLVEAEVPRPRLDGGTCGVDADSGAAASGEPRRVVYGAEDEPEFAAPLLLVDVRDRAEFDDCHIMTGSLLCPVPPWCCCPISRPHRIASHHITPGIHREYFMSVRLSNCCACIQVTTCLSNAAPGPSPRPLPPRPQQCAAPRWTSGRSASRARSRSCAAGPPANLCCTMRGRRPPPTWLTGSPPGGSPTCSCCLGGCAPWLAGHRC